MGADDVRLVAKRGIAPAVAGLVARTQILSIAGPAVLALRNRGTKLTTLAPVRRVGDLPSARPSDNLVFDARRALARLRSLWAILEADYQATVSAWASKAPGAQLTGTDLDPLIKAIRKGTLPVLANDVSTSFLPIPKSVLPDGQSVGAGGTNDPAQVAALQKSLIALDFLDANAASEVPANMPKTLVAIAELKRAIAAGTLGWAPLRAEEDREGGDKFGGRTYGPFPAGAPKFSVFIPTGAPPDKNFVHVFCAPSDVTGDGGDNNVLMQGVRSAFDTSKWIVVSVVGEPPGKVTVSTAEIQDLLKRVNRASTTIDGIRFSAHSRGNVTVWKTVTGTDAAGAKLVDTSLVDSVTIFDASYSDLGNGLRKAGLDSKARLYDPTVLNVSNIKGVDLTALWSGIRAIAYVRFIQDWIATTGGVFTIAADKMALANRLIGGSPPLPARGGFTTQGAAGKQDLVAFCNASKSAIAAITDPKTGLGDLVAELNLPQFFGSWRPPDASMEVHHYFVAELIHEAIGP